MFEMLNGFDWDEGNRLKCRKHGLSPEEVEETLTRPVLILPDEEHSVAEFRHKIIGRTEKGRHVFLVATLREREGRHYLRPISARYMHAKEVTRYEKENPHLQE